MFIVGRAFLFLIYDLIDKSSQRITFDNQYPYGYSIAYTPIGIKEERYGSVMKKSDGKDGVVPGIRRHKT